MKRIKKIVFVILSILLGLVLLFNVYNFISIKVFHKDLASINGYALLEVVSGSMEPTIHKGDIIIINTKEKNYKENDIITFRGKEGEFVTHRIKSINNEVMITKGDNNDSEDDPTITSAIVGKYVTKINGGGRILSSFKNPFTMIMIFVIGLLGCILLSTDSDGKPISENDDKEFQEFLKEKNKKDVPKEVKIKNIKEEKTLKKTKDASTKVTNKTSEKDTKETKNKKIDGIKKADSEKTDKEKKNTVKTPTKTVKVSNEKKAASKTTTNKVSKTKKVIPKTAATNKANVKKTPKKKVTAKSSKK